MTIITNNNVFDLMGKKYIREDSHWGCDVDLIKNSIDSFLKRKNLVRWLDVGCGTGYHITSIAEMYPEIDITGLDSSDTMLTEARMCIEKRNLKNVVLVKADIIDADISGTYDLITFLNNGLGNIYMNESTVRTIRKSVIRKVAGMLQPGGLFILGVYNRDKMDILRDYGSNLRIKPLSDVKNGDLLIEYSLKGNRVQYYSHWFAIGEIYLFSEDNDLEIDFIEERMARFLVRYKKS